MAARPQFSRPELKRLAEACWYAERDRSTSADCYSGANGAPVRPEDRGARKKDLRDAAAFLALRARINKMLAEKIKVD